MVYGQYSSACYGGTGSDSPDVYSPFDHIIVYSGYRVHGILFSYFRNRIDHKVLYLDVHFMEGNSYHSQMAKSFTLIFVILFSLLVSFVEADDCPPQFSYFTMGCSVSGPDAPEICQQFENFCVADPFCSTYCHGTPWQLCCADSGYCFFYCPDWDAGVQPVPPPPSPNVCSNTCSGGTYLDTHTCLCEASQCSNWGQPDYFARSYYCPNGNADTWGQCCLNYVWIDSPTCGCSCEPPQSYIDNCSSNGPQWGVSPKTCDCQCLWYNSLGYEQLQYLDKQGNTQYAGIAWDVNMVTVGDGSADITLTLTDSGNANASVSTQAWEIDSYLPTGTTTCCDDYD